MGDLITILFCSKGFALISAHDRYVYVSGVPIVMGNILYHVYTDVDNKVIKISFTHE